RGGGVESPPHPAPPPARPGAVGRGAPQDRPPRRGPPIPLPTFPAAGGDEPPTPPRPAAPPPARPGGVGRGAPQDRPPLSRLAHAPSRPSPAARGKESSTRHTAAPAAVFAAQSRDADSPHRPAPRAPRGRAQDP